MTLKPFFSTLWITKKEKSKKDSKKVGEIFAMDFTI